VVHENVRVDEGVLAGAVERLKLRNKEVNMLPLTVDV
jgi:hypothetical protein